MVKLWASFGTPWNHLEPKPFRKNGGATESKGQCWTCGWLRAEGWGGECRCFFFWVGDGSKNKKTYGGLNGKIISKCWEYDGIDGKRRLAGTIFLGILDFDNFSREIHGRNPRACIIIFPNIFREFQYHIAIFSMKITWEIPWKYHNNP